MTLRLDQIDRIETDNAASASAPRAGGTPSDAVPTLRLPFTNPCDHLDLCGDTLVEAQGDERWCTACGHRWRDTHVVIVNDEVAHGS
jgi:hypothetical protein